MCHSWTVWARGLKVSVGNTDTGDILRTRFWGVVGGALWWRRELGLCR